ncbi:cyclic peptide export ABC transporter [Desulfuromonas carbonis]|uniref:cyclic peptide export ABC transporter n=1 Tax=Desulfuromonas sp. DDH964 TaxID=1823759 RepID=UPI00078D791B|nr:cyclic peptide export ABC transporter [Desulfuromonas sp. DDH964]AMV71112.1 cell division ATP-binding protein FtsE [Desulfuromonas sp. DDH964]
MDLTIYRFLFSQAGPARSRILAATLVAGVANAAFMVIVNSVASDFSEISVRYFLMFILCILVYVQAKRYALLGTTRVVQQNLSGTNLRIIGSVRRMGLDGFDAVGDRTIYRSLLEHGEIIYESSRMAVSASSGAIMLLVSSVYIYLLSPTAFWIVLLVIGVGVMVYQLNQARTAAALRAYQANEVRFFALLDHFLSGFKELKVNVRKGDDLYHHFLATTLEETDRLKQETERSFVSSIVLSQTLFFLLMGAMVFLLPNFELTTPETTIAIVAVVLFVAGPIGIIVDSIPMLSKARLAIDSLQKLETRLAQHDDRSDQTAAAAPDDFARIVLQGVTYNYLRDDQTLFTLGPLDLTICKGQIHFVTGGNGSGKTTLMKLLAGLYYPQSGTIRLDGPPLKRADYGPYRELFSVIFTDFHLFDRLYGYRQTDPEQVTGWLQRLQIADKTGYSPQEGFGNLNLSTGQRKRIALVCALIEERPICLFDEVAADQDPEFREFFYREFLPELKAKGKTVIVISHDDRYFDIADELIKLDCGTLQHRSERS